MKNYKLITGETINYEHVAILEEYIEIADRNIIWNLLVVDKQNFIKGLRSINFNGVRESEVKTDGDYITLLLDYCTIQRGDSGKVYFILMFDDQEQCLAYILDDNETEKFKGLDENAGYSYLIDLMVA